MPNKLEALVAGALTNVRNPRVDNDLISAGMVKDLEVSEDGVVSFTFLLGREDPANLVRQARAAVRAVEGVTDVKVAVREPTGSTPAGSRPAARPTNVPPPPTPVEFPNLGNVIAISSGKGGVGKSTVSTNLAAQLARSGFAVGLMDADVYGPNVPRMLGITGKPPVRDQKIIPLEAHGVKVISLGMMVERDAPAIWRGPIIMKIIQQFIQDVAWDKLDYLFVDLPPGTGDAQLSLVQTISVKAAIIVTTPQEVAIGDGLRGAKMFEKVNVPVLGIVENMSYFECPKCHEQTAIFLTGGGERLAQEVDVPLLGRIPLQAGMAELADEGSPIVIAEPESAAAKSFVELARVVQKAMGGKKVSLPIV
jgi:ATP-binding protein involved in chromosome partitioning